MNEDLIKLCLLASEARSAALQKYFDVAETVVVFLDYANREEILTKIYEFVCDYGWSFSKIAEEYIRKELQINPHSPLRAIASLEDEEGR